MTYFKVKYDRGKYHVVDSNLGHAWLSFEDESEAISQSQFLNQVYQEGYENAMEDMREELSGRTVI